jgi:hypothetical protein
MINTYIWMTIKQFNKNTINTAAKLAAVFFLEKHKVIYLSRNSLPLFRICERIKIEQDNHVNERLSKNIRVSMNLITNVIKQLQ